MQVWFQLAKQQIWCRLLSSEGFLIKIVSLISEASLVLSSVKQKDGQLSNTSDLKSSINWAAFYAQFGNNPHLISLPFAMKLKITAIIAIIC